MSGHDAGQATEDRVSVGMRWGLPEAVLALITLLWASNFLITQLALEQCRPLGFLTLRFGIASVAFLVCFPRRLCQITGFEIAAGLAIGLTVFATFVPQTIGLLYISTAKSAFILALYVPFVPVLQWLLLKHRPRRAVWVGNLLAFAGLLVLSADEGLAVAFGVGEWLTLGAAVASALQIILVGRWAGATDPLRLAFTQIAVAALLCLVALPLVGEPFPPMTPTVVGTGVELGVVGTAFIFAAMNWGQRTVSPARATVIYASEPVWAALFGLLAGQWLTVNALVGGALIVLGVLVSELRLTKPAAPLAG